MTKLETNKILEVLHSKNWSKHYIIQNNELKKNIWFYINGIPEFDFVKNIINSDLKNINKEYKCSDWLTLLIYQEGDFFGLHNDDYAGSKNKIIFSGGYLLNDNYVGGEFIINGEKLNVNVGELFMFDRKYQHEVKHLKNGIRYSLHFAVEIENKITEYKLI